MSTPNLADTPLSATDRLFFEDYGPIPLAPSLGAAQEGPAHIMWTDTPASSSGWQAVCAGQSACELHL